jgi:hypothetical protein
MDHVKDNQDALLDYLYEEGDPSERLKIAQHLQDCTPCSVAVLELQAVRGVLSEWTPPPVPLGFKIVQERSTRAWWRPVAGSAFWAQTAAAVLLFATGMAVSRLDMNYSGGALTVRVRSAESGPAPTGAEQPSETANMVNSASVPMMPFTVNSARDSQSSAAAVDRSLPPQPTSRPVASVTTEELRREMRALIAQSEARQQRELALRLMQMGREFDTQRVADLMQVQRSFGQLETQTGAEMAQQRQLMEYFVKASGQR